MKCSIAGLMVILVLTVTASAKVTGSWSMQTSGGYDIFKFTVTSDEGILTGFDINVVNAKANNIDCFGDAIPSVALRAAFPNTSFFFANPDALSIAPGTKISSASTLGAVFAYQAGGIYDESHGGFGTTFDLLQIAVLAGNANISDFSRTASNGDDWGYASVGFGQNAYLVQIVPEPTMICLLGLGALALVRRQRR